MSASLCCPLLLSHKAGFSLFNVSYFLQLEYYRRLFQRHLRACSLSTQMPLLLAAIRMPWSLLPPPGPPVPHCICGRASPCSINPPGSRGSGSVRRPLHFRGRALYTNTPGALSPLLTSTEACEHLTAGQCHRPPAAPLSTRGVPKCPQMGAKPQRGAARVSEAALQPPFLSKTRCLPEAAS